MLKKMFRAAVRSAGFELAPVDNVFNLAFEVSLRRMFAERGVDLVIDVGANRGQYAHFLRRIIGFDGDIISFEPSPGDYAALDKEAASDPRWTVHPWALGETETTMTLNVAESSDFSSFLAPSSKHIAFPGNSVAERVAVPVKTIDDVLQQLSIDPSTRRLFVKSDVQGYDLQVFRGARRTLEHAVGLQTELSAIPIYDGMPDYLNALAELRASGYEVMMMVPVSAERGVAVEFDCVMLRRD